MGNGSVCLLRAGDGRWWIALSALLGGRGGCLALGPVLVIGEWIGLTMTSPVGKMSGVYKDRFWSRVRMTHTCWVWVGFVDPRGYGRFTPDLEAGQLAHRIAYKLMGGTFVDGLVLDHLCNNRRCVNPAHLDQVTQGENVRRAAAMGRYARWADKPEVCLLGHEYTPENTYVYKATGKRFCRKCNVHRNRVYRQRRAEAHV